MHEKQSQSHICDQQHALILIFLHLQDKADYVCRSNIMDNQLIFINVIIQYGGHNNILISQKLMNIYLPQLGSIFLSYILKIQLKKIYNLLFKSNLKQLVLRQYLILFLKLICYLNFQLLNFHIQQAIIINLLFQFYSNFMFMSDLPIIELKQTDPCFSQSNSEKISQKVAINEQQQKLFFSNQIKLPLSLSKPRMIRVKAKIPCLIKVPAQKYQNFQEFQNQTKFQNSLSPLTDCSQNMNTSIDDLQKNDNVYFGGQNKYWSKENFKMFVQQSYFESKYELLKKIGQGGHSSVYKCRNLQNNECYAVKITKNVDEQLKNRMIKHYKLLKVLDHPNVLKVYQLIYVQDEQKLYTISQLCQYSDLRVLINSKRQTKNPLPKQELVKILQKILQSVHYLHLSGISHRDLKPENILYNPKIFQIKIIDFDVCAEKYLVKQQFAMWTSTGTLHYKAPQTFMLGYNQKADVWSIGIILFELLFYKLPFESMYEKQTIKKIKFQNLDFSSLGCSTRLKFLLQKMLLKQSNLRFSCYQCLSVLNSSISINKKQKDDFHIVKQVFLTSLYGLQTSLNSNNSDDSATKVCPSYKAQFDFLNWHIHIHLCSK